MLSRYILSEDGENQIAIYASASPQMIINKCHNSAEFYTLNSV